MQELKALWTLLLPQTEPPVDSQWALWLMLHNPDSVREGVLQLATKYRTLGGVMDETYRVKFASSVMNRASRETRTPKSPA